MAFTVQTSKSKVDSSTKHFTCTFSRPLSLSTSTITSTAASIQVIYAVGLQTVQTSSDGDPQKATPQKHSYTGSGTLTIVRKDGSSSETNATTPTGTSGDGSGSTDDVNQLIADDKFYKQHVKIHGKEIRADGPQFANTLDHEPLFTVAVADPSSISRLGGWCYGPFRNPHDDRVHVPLPPWSIPGPLLWPHPQRLPLAPSNPSGGFPSCHLWVHRYS